MAKRFQEDNMHGEIHNTNTAPKKKNSAAYKIGKIEKTVHTAQFE